MDVTILSIIAFTVLVLIVSLSLFLKQRGNVENEEPRIPERQEAGPGARRRALAANRNARMRQRVVEEDEDENAEIGTESIELPDGKVGAKKLAKLQAKADRKAQREAEEKIREDRKKSQEKAEEERKQADDKAKAEEQAQLEAEKKAKEEKERQEHEEYLKLKAAFAVEEEGFEAGEEEGGNTFKDFINYIKDNKVVVLEDLAARFKLKTQQAIERIQSMQADGMLTGVIDDRGKFICVSPEELTAVARFVQQRGRVSIVELVDNSNLLVDLTPAATVLA